MLDLYVPLLVMALLAGAFALVSVALSPLIGPRRYHRAKLDAYECGIEPSPQPTSGGGRIPVPYHFTAMMFLLFDLELVFLYAYVVNVDDLGLFGLVAITVFLVPVAIAYAYEWRRGGLEWT